MDRDAAAAPSVRFVQRAGGCGRAPRDEDELHGQADVHREIAVCEPQHGRHAPNQERQADQRRAGAEDAVQEERGNDRAGREQNLREELSEQDRFHGRNKPHRGIVQNERQRRDRRIFLAVCGAIRPLWQIAIDRHHREEMLTKRAVAPPVLADHGDMAGAVIERRLNGSGRPRPAPPAGEQQLRGHDHEQRGAAAAPDRLNHRMKTSMILVTP